MNQAATDAVFHALGDPTRRKMLAILARRKVSVSELASTLSISKSAVGQHLAVLERGALARTSKVGRVRTCQFNADGLTTVQDWINFHRHEWTDRIDRLDEMLQEEIR